jgi:hypothetical protein
MAVWTVKKLTSLMFNKIFFVCLFVCLLRYETEEPFLKKDFGPWSYRICSRNLRTYFFYFGR